MRNRFYYTPYLEGPEVRSHKQHEALPYSITPIGGPQELVIWRNMRLTADKQNEEKLTIRKLRAVDAFMTPGLVPLEHYVAKTKKQFYKKLSKYQQVKQFCVKWMLDTLNSAFGR